MNDIYQRDRHVYQSSLEDNCLIYAHYKIQVIRVLVERFTSSKNEAIFAPRSTHCGTGRDAMAEGLMVMQPHEDEEEL